MKKVIFGFLILALTNIAGAATPGDANPLNGLTDLNGAAWKPALEKDKLLVVFWATWCDECRAKLNKELVELNSHSDLAVITVNADRESDRVKEFVAKENVSLPVLRDDSKSLRRSLKVFSVPHWALFKKGAQANSPQLVMSEPAFDYSHVLNAIKSVTQ